MAGIGGGTLVSTASDSARQTPCGAGVLFGVALLIALPTQTYAGDLPLGAGYAYPTATPSGWQFRLTPYAWAPSVNGDVTVRGQTVDIDMSFWDLFDSGKSKVELDSLAALMGYMEARKGPWGVYGDVVWGKFDFSSGAVKQRNPIANLTLSASAKAGLNYEITMAESGLTYEVARWGATNPTSLDLLGGARYWDQELELSLAVNGFVDLGKLGLTRAGSRAIARSGTLEWVDPFVGFRLRHQFAPGNELQFLGDIGGFGVGSDLTWQLFAGYGFDFSVCKTTLYGVVGYRALAVDYSQDNGGFKNNLDLILHGPVAGLSFRW
jgi:hypothetical protein